MSTISEQLQQLNNIKNNFKKTINAKGGSITDTTPFSEYPSQVENLSGGGGGSKAIIDVEELPKASWSGTAVPNSGTLSAFYANFNLSDDEITELLSKLTYTEISADGETVHLYVGFCGGSENEIWDITVMKLPGEENAFSIMSFTYGMPMWVNKAAAESMGLDVGWQDGANSETLYDTPVPLHNTFTFIDQVLEVGTQNELLSSLFSTTPFEKIELNADPNYLYRTPDNTIYQLTSKTTEGEMKWNGTSVPTNGYIDKIYVNTMLDAEEVADILRTIRFNEVEESGSTHYVYYMLKDTTDHSYDFKCEWIPSHLSENGQDSFMVYSNNFTRDAVFTYNWSGYRFDGFHSFFNQTQDYIDLGINVSYVEEDVEYPTGSQNDLLSPIFSTTLPEKKPEVVVVKEFEQISKPAIIDVEELPAIEGKWVGTPVPAHGFVDKVYFNKNLTKEETLAILGSVQLGNYSYHFAKNNNYNVSVYNLYNLGYSKSSGYDFVCLFDGSGTYGGDGWADNCPEYVELQFEADEYPGYGEFNEQLSSLVSSTPFERIVSNIDPNCLYRTPNGKIYQLVGAEFKPISEPAIVDVEKPLKLGWNGTAVPNSGAITKVYFNNNLSIEEVKNIVAKLEIDEEYGQYIVSSNADYSYSIEVFTGGSDVAIVYFPNNSEEIVIFASDMGGFNTEITDFTIDVNYESVSEIYFAEVGDKNDLLSSLISITPFEYVEPDTVNPNCFYRTPDNTIYQLANKTVEVDKWDGTPIPTEGDVERIYVNTKLNTEEVVDILRTIQFNEIEESGSTYYVYYMLRDTAYHSYDFRCEWKPSHLNEGGTDGFVIYSNNFTQGAIFSYNWNGSSSINGWHKFFLNQNYFNIGGTVSSVDEGLEYPAGYQNDLLVSLFSTTPFEKKLEAVVVKEFEQISKPAIVDVKKLPKADWKGTAVPNSGTITKWYINNNLSIEEVKNIVAKLEIDEEYGQYIISSNTDGSCSIGFFTNGFEVTIVYFPNSSEAITIFASDEVFEESFVGFNPEITNFNFDVNYESVSELSGMEVGVKNELLSSLISITPFKKVAPNVDPNYLYRTPDSKVYQLVGKEFEPIVRGENQINDLANSDALVTHDAVKEYVNSKPPITDVEELPKASWKGTPVPNSGTITKLYFNNNLSIEEVENIVAKLEPGEGYREYEVFGNTSGSRSVRIFTDGSEIGITYYINGDPTDIFANGERFGNDLVGFNPEITDFSFDVNYEAISEYDGMLIGNKNELLSSLISITPFKYGIGDPNCLYRTPDSKIYQLVGEEFKPINEPAIIDVKGPPSTTGKWVGTPLPAHGFIDKVYFNKNLTKEETLAILDSVELDDSRYSFAKNSQYDVFIWNRYDLGYSWSSGWEFVCLFSGNGRYNLDGWADDCPEYVELKFEADENSEYGKYNEQLSSLVSSTPFEYIEPVTANESVLYRTPDGSLYSYKSNKFVKLITSDDNIGTDPEVLDAIDALETQIGNINTILDDILGEGE